MTYGQAVAGVPPSMLLQQRRAAASAVAFAGMAGQSLDLALMIADESSRGRADPAFVAHRGPIGEWAQAVWESWLPQHALLQLAASAKHRLAVAAQQWAAVLGPGAAYVATAGRLGWTVHDAVNVTTDTGLALNLREDPPIVIARECDAAVGRWRWRAVELAHPSLDSGGADQGANFAPIQKLLRATGCTQQWPIEFRTALRSAVVNRQWTQSRCFAAGFTSHNRCCLCLAVAKARAGCAQEEPAPPDVLDAVPVGTAFHRVVDCPAHSEARGEHAPACVRQVQPMQSNCIGLTRGLFPSLAHLVPPPAQQETFHWVVRPSAGTIRARFYSDGSRLDGPTEMIAHNGWAFVGVDAQGHVLAIARGLPPP